MALDLIETGVQHLHPYAPLIEYIRAFRSRPWQLIFRHTLREGNACADLLAKFGANSDDGLTIWTACPAQLSATLLADAIGILRIRL